MALDTTPDFPSGKRRPYTRTSTRYTIDATQSRMWPPGAAARRRRWGPARAPAADSV